MSRQKLKDFIYKTNGLDRFLLLILIIGAGITLISLFRGITEDRQVQVEFLSGDSASNVEGSKIFVDIEGAVIKPGVYELSKGSRIKDVLILAGGFSEAADRDFCERSINQAEVVKDGQKIYIPIVPNTNTQQGYMEAMASSKKVSINTSTVVELDTLWGIGASRADAIVKNRPYQSIDDLVTKGVLSQSLVDRNREMMSLY